VIALGLAEAVSHRQPDHAHLFWRQFTFQGAQARSFGGHDAQIHLRVVPEGVRGHQVGHHGDERGCCFPRARSTGLMANGCTETIQVGGMVGNQAAHGAADEGPGSIVDQAGLCLVIRQVVT